MRLHRESLEHALTYGRKVWKFRFDLSTDWWRDIKILSVVAGGDFETRNKFLENDKCFRLLLREILSRLIAIDENYT